MKYKLEKHSIWMNRIDGLLSTSSQLRICAKQIKFFHDKNPVMQAVDNDHLSR